MQVDVGDHQPIKMRSYRTPLKNREVIDKAVDEMMNANIIRRSRSPWSFLLLLWTRKTAVKDSVWTFENSIKLQRKIHILYI